MNNEALKCRWEPGFLGNVSALLDTNFKAKASQADIPIVVEPTALHQRRHMSYKRIVLDSR